ncbi:MAG: DUF1330 domain-containing protein [Rhodospirillales bacterium]|nr:DUF1330 domain-containing protein [Rhodospirillales bacterium]
MPVYLVSNVEVHDREKFRNYQKPGRAAVFQYGGKFLAEGAAPEPIEGDWLPKRMAIVEFENAEAARAFYNSPEYQAARQHRLPAATFKIVMVDPETGVIGELE